MGSAHQALCYFYRNPPAHSGVKPQPYRDIAKLIQLPHTPVDAIRKVVQRFHVVRQVCGGKPGWRKTTPAEDANIMVAFRKVRRSLESQRDSVTCRLPFDILGVLSFAIEHVQGQCVGTFGPKK